MSWHSQPCRSWIPSSETCSDTTFIRRTTLDAAGCFLPEDERFLSDRRPDKRGRWIESPLTHRWIGDHWAIKWTDLLRPNPDRAGIKSVYVRPMVRQSFRKNMPYDAFVRSILTPEGKIMVSHLLPSTGTSAPPKIARSFSVSCSLGSAWNAPNAIITHLKSGDRKTFTKQLPSFNRSNKRAQGFHHPFQLEPKRFISIQEVRSSTPGPKKSCALPGGH